MKIRMRGRNWVRARDGPAGDGGEYRPVKITPVQSPSWLSRQVPPQGITARADACVPADAYAGSAPAQPTRVSRLTHSPGWLKSAGLKLAHGALNGIAGVGLFLLGARVSREKLERYEEGEKLLGTDFHARVATSALSGLQELFVRPDLPGETARERLDFVLWYTDSNRGSDKGAWERLQQICTHFQCESPFLTHANDRGFASDVADGRKWYNPDATGYVMDIYCDRVDQGSPQVGHFLTAVDLGHQPGWKEALLRPAAVGHELVGDDRGAVPQIVAGLRDGKARQCFREAIEAAMRGERGEAHRLVEVALPDLSDSGNEPGRVGNSRQDLLNTSYGFAFGRLLRADHFASRQEAVDWLEHNVGSSAPSLPWNDPIGPR